MKLIMELDSSWFPFAIYCKKCMESCMHDWDAYCLFYMVIYRKVLRSSKCKSWLAKVTYPLECLFPIYHRQSHRLSKLITIHRIIETIEEGSNSLSNVTVHHFLSANSCDNLARENKRWAMRRNWLPRYEHQIF